MKKMSKEMIHKLIRQSLYSALLIVLVLLVVGVAWLNVDTEKTIRLENPDIPRTRILPPPDFGWNEHITINVYNDGIEYPVLIEYIDTYIGSACWWLAENPVETFECGAYIPPKERPTPRSWEQEPLD